MKLTGRGYSRLIGEGAAWDFFRTFLQRCVLRVADTEETVTLDSLLSIGLSIQGWFANKDSKASKENVRVSAKLLKELNPTDPSNIIAKSN